MNQLYYAKVFSFHSHLPSLLKVVCLFFTMKWYWILSNAFSVSIEMTMWLLSFILLMWCIIYSFIFIFWTILSSHPCFPLGHGVWAVRFSVLIFCWGFLRLYLSELLAYSFLVVSLYGFGSKVKLTSQNEFRSVPSSSSLWKGLRTTGVNSSLSTC